MAARERRRRQLIIPYLFLLPFLVLFLLFLVLPLGYALGISVFADRLVGGTVFVGAENYVRAFTDPAFLGGVRRLLVYGVFQVPIMLGFALVLALVLDSGVTWFRTLFRLGFFLPYAVPSVVAALIWGYLYGQDFGPFAQLAGYLGLPAPDFLSENWILPSIANIVTWEFTGYNMIILYAALQAVPGELRDAGAVDGAKGWQIALYIKIPLILPALFLTVVFSIIGTLQLFNEPQLLQPLAPGAIGQAFSPNLYAYSLAFTNQQYEYSAAISFALGAVVVVCSYVFMLVTNRGEARG
ncbi:ABC transporter permease subunit [Rubrobacter tropicus]|uniref:ABC transporter permease subunit n=1 Tax=Rubrobacter tropicus TaxID=2653851 RepID=A0A6G8QF92_9ACTN|nr:ABC transporter permease subunit [Rubrobacter tropicus]